MAGKNMWWNIISNGAVIADIAKQIYTSIKTDKAKGSQDSPNESNIGNLQLRIDYLEKNEIRQAELVKQLAENTNAIAKKAQNAFILAIISTIIAAGSIIWQLLDK